MKAIIEKLIDKQDLTIDEAYSSMIEIMNGEVNHARIASFLTAIKSKGEAAVEIAGFAKAIREKSIKIETETDNTIDVCGTGGDYSNTFNISTAVAFAVAGAGAGVKVAKHGNRAISSNSGSADVLSELGINTGLSPENSRKALEKIGISFLSAPQYHPAMKHVASVRKELGLRTIFNILGPLVNPATTKKQLIGTFNNHTSGLMAEASKYLDMDKVCFVCTSNRYDEILLTDNTYVTELKKDSIAPFFVGNTSFNYPKIDITKITGGSPKESAALINKVFTSKTKDDAFLVVAANTAFALYTADYSHDLETCKAAAEESILSGKAYEKLKQLREFGEKYP